MMTRSRETRPASAPALIGPVGTGLMILTFVLLMVGVTVYLAWPAEDLPGRRALIDFQVFHIAGQLAGVGDLDTAYHSDRFVAHIQALTGSPGLMFCHYGRRIWFSPAAACSSIFSSCGDWRARITAWCWRCCSRRS
jgi:hypothetical protein